MPIDIHAHYVPPQLIAAIDARGKDIGVKLALELGIKRYSSGSIGRGAGLYAQLRPVAANGRQSERFEDAIKVVEFAAAHEGKRAGSAFPQLRQGLVQGCRNPDRLRRRREIENGPVHIEENRQFAEINRE